MERSETLEGAKAVVHTAAALLSIEVTRENVDDAFEIHNEFMESLDVFGVINMFADMVTIVRFYRDLDVEDIERFIEHLQAAKLERMKEDLETTDPVAEC